MVRRAILKVERDLAAELDRLIAELHESRTEMGLAPQAVQQKSRS